MKTRSLVLPSLILCAAALSSCAVSRVGREPAPIAATSKTAKTPAMKPRAQTLLKEFAAAPQFWRQAAVGEKLIALGDQSAIASLSPLLRSPARDVRINAGRVLAGLGDERGLFAVIAELEDKAPRPTEMLADDGVTKNVKGQIVRDRYSAAQTLAVIGDARARPALENALGDPDIGYQAAIMLGELGDKRAIPALLEALKRGAGAPQSFATQDNMKLWAGYGLLALGDPKGTEEVTDVLLGDKQWTARRHAAEALTKWGDARAVPALVRAVKDPQIEVRVNAITALGRIGDARALPALQIAARDKKAASAAARIGFGLVYHEGQTDFVRLTTAQAATRAIAQIKAKK